MWNSRGLIALATLFLAGFVHWFLFYGGGLAEQAPVAADWPVAARYHAVLQQAVREGRVPYYVSRPIQETRKFLSNPEVLWSPEVALLGVMSVKAFFVAHTLMLYCLSFVGYLVIAKHYRLSLLPFTFLFLLFGFNGHITAHLAVGHSMWTGYFLLPFFVFFVLELLEGPTSRTPLKLALTLFAILLQGAWHLFVWCVVFLVLIVAFNRHRARAVLAGLCWSALLGVCRLLPAGLVLYEKKDQMFLSGYPSALDLVAALTMIRDVTFERRGGLLATLNWWEYDAYVGVVGLAFLLWFGLLRRRSHPTTPQGGLGGPMLVMFLLSLHDLYFAFNRLPIPLLSSERVSSRFLILPLVFLIVISARSLQLALESGGTKLMRWGLAAAAAGLALSLGAHSRVWRVDAVETALRARPPRDLTIAIADPPPNPTPRDTRYVAGTKLAALCSLGAGAVLALRLRRRLGAPLV